MEGFILILVTASSLAEGRKIARALVEARLCACVNLIDGVHSSFWWEGGIHDEEEVLLLCKARERDFDGVKERVKELHSYTVPEVIALPIVAGSREYLSWVFDETHRETPEET